MVSSSSALVARSSVSASRLSSSSSFVSPMPGLGVCPGVVAFVGAGPAGSLASASPVFSSLVRSVSAVGRLPVVSPRLGAPVSSFLGGAGFAIPSACVGPAGFRREVWRGLGRLASRGRVACVVPSGSGISARSLAVASLVRAVAGGGSGSALVLLAFSPCPLGLSPSLPVVGPWPLPLPVGVRPSLGGWGWPAAARAAGLGLRVVVFVPPSVGLPAWSGGSWVPAASAGSGVWASGWRWRPFPVRAALSAK